MTLTLELTPNLAARLQMKAASQGLSADRYTLSVLEQHLVQQENAVNLLQQWLDEEDAGEQQATGNFLIEALDTDRLANRELFSAALEGVTW